MEPQFKRFGMRGVVNNMPLMEHAFRELRAVQEAAIGVVLSRARAAVMREQTHVEPELLRNAEIRSVINPS